MDNLTEFEQYLVNYMDWNPKEDGWDDYKSNMEAVWDYQQKRIMKAEAEIKRLVFELQQHHEQSKYVVKKLEADNDRLRAENTRLRKIEVAAIDAVEYMRLASPHPSEAMDNLE